ncbi:MAG TPA: hypothetical protein VGG57_13945 [Stellaceae bacterium]
MRLALGAVPVAAAVALNGAVAAGLTPHDPVLGNYRGSGRACYGMLTITTHRIFWTTPFSRCIGSPYDVRGKRDGADGVRMTFVLSRPGARCRYPVLELTKRPGDDPAIGWEVAGYRSLDSGKRGGRDDSISCYLYR